MLVMAASMSASVGFGLSQQGGGRHDHAGLAEAALRHIERPPEALNRVAAVPDKPSMVVIFVLA